MKKKGTFSVIFAFVEQCRGSEHGAPKEQKSIGTAGLPGYADTFQSYTIFK